MSKRARKRSLSLLQSDVLHPVAWQCILTNVRCEPAVALVLLAVCRSMATLLTPWLRQYFAALRDRQNATRMYTEFRVMTDLLPCYDSSLYAWVWKFGEFATAELRYDTLQWARLLSMLSLVRAHRRLCFSASAIQSPVSVYGTYDGGITLSSLFYKTPQGFQPLSALPGLCSVRYPAGADALVAKAISDAVPSPEKDANERILHTRQYYQNTNWITYERLRLNTLRRLGALEWRCNLASSTTLRELVWNDEPVSACAEELGLISHSGILQSQAEMQRGIALHFYVKRNASTLRTFFRIACVQQLDAWMRQQDATLEPRTCNFETPT